MIGEEYSWKNIHFLLGEKKNRREEIFGIFSKLDSSSSGFYVSDG
jgi:hypothetical protein